MKVSNETKIGALTAVAITILILGYSFLKGQSLFNKKRIVYAVYENTSGLPESAPVTLKGLPIGITGKKIKSDKYATKIIVPIILNDNELELPSNSIATISGSPLGISSSVIEITRGTDMTKFLKNGDTILTKAPESLMADLNNQITPLVSQVKNTLTSLDSVVDVLGNTMDPQFRANLQGILRNVNTTTSNLSGSTKELEVILAQQNKNVTQALGNVNKFVENLNNNNKSITSTLSNLDKTSANFAQIDVNPTLNKLNVTIDNLNKLVNEFANSKGSLGLLMKDPELYNQLNNLTFSLNTLVDDVKVNPKRYISIFGRKDKKIAPLNKPIYDSVPK